MKRENTQSFKTFSAIDNTTGRRFVIRIDSADCPPDPGDLFKCEPGVEFEVCTVNGEVLSADILYAPPEGAVVNAEAIMVYGDPRKNPAYDLAESLGLGSSEPTTEGGGYSGIIANQIRAGQEHLRARKAANFFHTGKNADK